VLVTPAFSKASRDESLNASAIQRILARRFLAEGKVIRRGFKSVGKAAVVAEAGRNLLRTIWETSGDPCKPLGKLIRHVAIRLEEQLRFAALNSCCNAV